MPIWLAKLKGVVGTSVSMSKHNNQLQVGYRRGVVLGLTIAEIILLILFALLLALTGVLMKKQAQIRAEMDYQTE